MKTKKPYLPPEVQNSRRKPRPRASWRYEGVQSAEDWVKRADDKARMCRAIAALQDGRGTHARYNKEVAELLLQGVVCVYQLQKR